MRQMKHKKGKEENTIEKGIQQKNKKEKHREEGIKQMGTNKTNNKK